MASMPQTPGGDDARGRSRFSKALPVPPNGTGTAPTASPLYSAPLHTPKFSLPPLPKAIPRKALGMTADQRALSAALSRATNSPMYSNFPAVPKPLTPVSTSTSDDSSSAMGSSSGRESDATTPPMNTPPTLPPKDNQSQYPRRQTNRTPSPVPSPETTIAALQNSPPELWKRRSVKSDRSLHFNELKLDRSNGSTASPPRQELPEPTAKGPLPALPRSNTQPPSRKPVPAPAAAPPPAVPMGAKISKLKDKASTTRSPFQYSSSDSRQDERPPTPDYSVVNAPANHSQPHHVTNGGAGGRKDIRGAHQDLQTNLRTPHTPPFEKDVAVPTIPLRADSRTALSLLTNLLSHENESTSTLQAPTNTHSRETSSETVTIRSPQPKAPDAHILLASPTDSSPIDLHSPIDLPSPIPPSSGSGSASGDDARRGRSRQSMSTSHFPVLPPSTIHPADFMLPALPLTNIQFDCYQNHKSMRAARNNICPVACMLCAEGGTDMRWRCTWCCLSCCADCMKVLTREEVGKDLRLARDIVSRVGGMEGFREVAV